MDEPRRAIAMSKICPGQVCDDVIIGLSSWSRSVHHEGASTFHTSLVTRRSSPLHRFGLVMAYVSADNR